MEVIWRAPRSAVRRGVRGDGKRKLLSGRHGVTVSAPGRTRRDKTGGAPEAPACPRRGRYCAVSTAKDFLSSQTSSGGERQIAHPRLRSDSTFAGPAARTATARSSPRLSSQRRLRQWRAPHGAAACGRSSPTRRSAKWATSSAGSSRPSPSSTTEGTKPPHAARRSFAWKASARRWQRAAARDCSCQARLSGKAVRENPQHACGDAPQRRRARRPRDRPSARDGRDEIAVFGTHPYKRSSGLARGFPTATGESESAASAAPAIMGARDAWIAPAAPRVLIPRFGPW
jgi:hypothetical protein